MKIMVINQEPLTVTEDQGRKLMQQIANGAEMIVIGSEMVKTSAIMGIRNDESGETISRLQWGMLPEGTLDHFFDERRETPGKGYEKFATLKDKLFNKSGKAGV